MITTPLAPSRTSNLAEPLARFAVVAAQRKTARALFFFARDVISQARADVARFSDKESFMAAKKKAAKKAKKKL